MSAPTPAETEASSGLFAGLPGLVLLAFGLYAALVAVLYLVQGRLVYLPSVPSRELMATPARLGLAFEDLALTTEDGVRLHGWYVPVPGPRGVILFAHGNAGNISHRLDSIDLFHRLGFDVLIFDYRGYGASAGRPSEQGTYLDIAAAWRELTERRDIPARRIVLFGRSLGGPVAAWLAAREQPAGLILESTFTSLPDLAADIYPYLPTRPLLRYRYPTAQHLTEVTAPVLVIHSKDDEVVPLSHGQHLAGTAGVDLLELQGGHNDAFVRSAERYLTGLQRFFDQVLTAPGLEQKRGAARAPRDKLRGGWHH